MAGARRTELVSLACTGDTQPGLLTLDKPRILGIVNVTPDSFSDGGRLTTVDDARRLIDRLIVDGADVIDIGGESTRPQGATPVARRRRTAPRDSGDRSRA